MELGGEVVCHPVCSSDVVEGDLKRVEVPDFPRQGEVHGAELDDDALQILDRNAPLAIGYPQKGDYLKASLGGQGRILSNYQGYPGMGDLHPPGYPRPVLQATP